MARSFRILGKTLSAFILAFILLSPGCKKDPTTVEIEGLGGPVIWVDQYELIFQAAVSSDNPDSQTLKVKNSGSNLLEYEIGSDTEWLRVVKDEGTSSGEINQHTISIDKSGMESREKAYVGELIVTSPMAHNNPQRISITLKLGNEPPPAITVNPDQLTFIAQEDGSAPPEQLIFIRNSGEGTLRFKVESDAAWISVDPETGTSKTKEKTVRISVKPKGLKEGRYKGKISVADPDATNSPQEVAVTLNITKEPPPAIKTSPAKFNVQAMAGGGNPSAQVLTVGNSGGGNLKYVIDWDSAWMTVKPNSGSSKGAEKQHSVAFSTKGLSSGTYRGTITITSTNAINSPKNIAVTLEIRNVLPPSTENAIGISLSPGSAAAGTIISIPISVRGNLQLIKVFGLEVHFDPNMFQYQSTNKGALTGSWAAVAGNEISSGVIKIGGFMGSGTAIPVGSSNTIAIVRLIVTGSSYGNGQASQLSINTFTDDISGMKASPASATFTLNK